MNESTDSTLKSADDEIDLRELFRIVWEGKWIVIVITLIFAVGSVFYALSLPNFYKTEVTLAPAGDEGGGMRVPSQLGGLASLAGISLGGGGDTSKTDLALAVLNSKQFKMNFIDRHEILPELMAVEDWNRESNELVYSEAVFDTNTGTWTRDVAPPLQPKPSLQEAVKVFNEILTVSEDKKTGLVVLGIEYISPYLARDWVTWLVSDLNENMREREKTQSAKSIAYLEQKIEETRLADIKEVLYELIEEQTKTYMFTEVREEYIFKTIDPAIVPELKAGPSRALICIQGTLLGGFIGVALAFGLRLLRKHK